VLIVFNLQDMGCDMDTLIVTKEMEFSWQKRAIKHGDDDPYGIGKGQHASKKTFFTDNNTCEWVIKSNCFWSSDRSQNKISGMIGFYQHIATAQQFDLRRIDERSWFDRRLFYITLFFLCFNRSSVRLTSCALAYGRLTGQKMRSSATSSKGIRLGFERLITVENCIMSVFIP